MDEPRTINIAGDTPHEQWTNVLGAAFISLKMNAQSLETNLGKLKDLVQLYEDDFERPDFEEALELARSTEPARNIEHIVDVLQEEVQRLIDAAFPEQDIVQGEPASVRANGMGVDPRSAAIEAWSPDDPAVDAELEFDYYHDDLCTVNVITPDGTVSYRDIHVGEPFGTPEHSYIELAYIAPDGSSIPLGSAEVLAGEDASRKIALQVRNRYADAVREAQGASPARSGIHHIGQ